jgi:mannosyltransferase OCH1-like enzyme
MSYSANIYRADAVRYFYLYHYGGIYADIDSVCLKDFEPLLKEHDDADVVFGNLTPTGASNALIISKPRADFWLGVFYALMTMEHIEGNSPVCETGSMLINYCIHEYNKKNIRESTWYVDMWRKLSLKPTEKKSVIKIIDDKYFYSINCNYQEHQEKYRKPLFIDKKVLTREELKEMFPEAYSVTFWMNSW